MTDKTVILSDDSQATQDRITSQLLTFLGLLRKRFPHVTLLNETL